MMEMIMETVVQIASTLLITLIGVLGTWLTLQISKQQELASIATATGEVTAAAQETVLALQQTTVEGLKAAHADGKLTKEEIQGLGIMLVEQTMKKLSQPAKNILTAAGKDITAIIQDVGESMILEMKPGR